MDYAPIVAECDPYILLPVRRSWDRAEKTKEIMTASTPDESRDYWDSYWAAIKRVEEIEEGKRIRDAAPELYKALKEITDAGTRDLTNQKYDGCFESARLAIARAQGLQVRPPGANDEN